MNGAFRFRSTTYTFRAKRLLERNGITATAVRIPKELAVDGCGYLIMVKQERMAAAQEILRANGIPVQQVYPVYPVGRG